MGADRLAARPDLPGSQWVRNGSLQLHYLAVGPAVADRPGLVVVPGFGEDATDWLELLEAVQPRPAVAVDLRGRGRSDIPPTGYGIDDHAADLDAVVDDAGLDRLHLVTYSRGTSYGLAWALAHPERIASVTIGDYPPVQIVPPDWLPNMAAKRIWRGRPMAERISRPVVEAILIESKAVAFWDELGGIPAPMLVIRGGAEGAMVSPEVEARYRAAVPGIEVVCFDESGHDLWTPDPGRFTVTVLDFIDRVDAAHAA